MKKVLFVIDSLNCGGAEKSLVSLLSLLDKEKYEIHLEILHRGGAFESLLPSNIIIEDEPKYNVWESILLNFAHILYSFVFRINDILNQREHKAETLWKCLGWAKKAPEQQFDIAVAYQQGFPTYLVSEKIFAKKKVAWINADIFLAGYDARFNQKYYDLFDVIVPVSKKLEVILEQVYPQYTSKYYIIYDVLNPQIIKRRSQEPIREIVSDSNQVVLVTTGRLVPPKNHLLAVEVAKRLHDKGINYKWLFIGEGSERPKIEDLISKYGLEDRVLLLGMRQNPYPYMARCTIYVQTSLFEGYGLTIAEAKILGRPVVSTNFDVVCDQIKHEQNGLIAEMTPESVTDNILRLINDTDLRIRIIENVNKEKNTTYMTEVEKVEKLFDAN